jgi:outer membrane protein assembly factor BamB
VATPRFLVAGEMDFTDLATGRLDANRITKAACSRDAGLVLANGLIYAAPKHCICWPMLRDYVAMAPAGPGGATVPQDEDLHWAPQSGPAPPPDAASTPPDPEADWPCYRHDAWRSGSTTGPLPTNPKILWTADLGGWPSGTIAEDWRHHYFCRGPLGSPVIAGGLVYVARPDAHQLVALDAKTGRQRWTFTANGRIDTAPTIHAGLCLFGTRSGWVYGLRADDGRLVWRLRAAPLDERIVAYGQVESPWPVPGSVLVVDGVAYFAAGRQPLADGGIFIFAVEPATGKTRWVRRLNTVPQTEFYGSSGLEFDNFDLLQREGDAVAMSRWLLDRTSGSVTCDEKSGFAHLVTGGSGVMFPRGCWSYAPLNETERWKERPFLRPLAVFRDEVLYSCSQDRATVFRRDFHLGEGEKFDTEWFAGWTTYDRASKGGDLWRSQRLARNARWSVTPLAAAGPPQPVSAMTLGRNALAVVTVQGRLALLATDDGSLLGRADVPPPAWDGLAAAAGRLYLSTQDGRVVCLGE